MIKKNLIVSAAALTALLAASCGKTPEPVIESGTAAAGDSGYAYKFTAGQMQFQWRVAGAEKALNVQLTGPGGAWLGAGFNPTLGMKDANFVIGTIRDGHVSVSDDHGVDRKKHMKDTDLGGEDNIKNAVGTEPAGKTVIGFTIPLASTDALDKPIFPDSNTVVLLAAGQSNQPASRHSFWAKARVNLSTGAYAITLLKNAK